MFPFYSALKFASSACSAVGMPPPFLHSNLFPILFLRVPGWKMKAHLRQSFGESLLKLRPRIANQIYTLSSLKVDTLKVDRFKSRSLAKSRSDALKLCRYFTQMFIVDPTIPPSLYIYIYFFYIYIYMLYIIYIYIYIFYIVYMFVYIYIYIMYRLYIILSLSLSLYIYIYIYIFLYTYIYVVYYIYIYSILCICSCTYIYIYIYILYYV